MAEAELGTPPSLRTLAAADDLRVVRRLFYGGFAFLPWLWFVGWVQFRASARKPDADPRLASLVRSCLVGAVASAVAFASWVALVRIWPGLGDALALLKAHP